MINLICIKKIIAILNIAVGKEILRQYLKQHQIFQLLKDRLIFFDENIYLCYNSGSLKILRNICNRYL